MNKIAKIVAAGVSTVALVGGIGAGIAAADPTTSPTPTATPTAKDKPADKKDRPADKHRDGLPGRRALLARALHGEATLGGEKHRVVAFQRGVVQEVSATSLTVKSEDGFTATYVLNGDTKVHKQGDKSTISAIKSGDHVRVLALKDGSTLTAKAVGDRGQ
jgi:hypothetical protein